MTYNLLVVDRLRVEGMGVAVARGVGVDVGAVEVADADGDPELRNWDADVSCEFAGVFGDFAWSLSIYVQDVVGPRPAEAEFAARFAEVAGSTVLYPAVEAPPSAYWAVTPEGLVTRARLELSDDEPPVLTVTAVEAPVPQLPRAVVTWFEEIVREQRPATPVAEGFVAAAGGRPDSGLLGSVTGSLVVWERLVRQMESGWAPSGWYPAALYRERLEARDCLAQDAPRLPRDVAALLGRALETLDGRFAEATEEDCAGELLRGLELRSDAAAPVGWWWFRRPAVVPWERGQGR